jgi:hypothetical protein
MDVYLTALLHSGTVMSQAESFHGQGVKEEGETRAQVSLEEAINQLECVR